jgi:hypothetical protein
MIVLIIGAVIAVQAAIGKGDKAPNFTLVATTGKSVSLNDIRKAPGKKAAPSRIVLMEFGEVG